MLVPHLHAGVDPHIDACVETLHTYLIGNDKYVWHETNKSWCKVKEGDFAVRLQSSSIDGLTLPAVRASYIAQYKNSLIGKHFKALQQLAVFHMHEGLCPAALFHLWLATGELGAMLWFHEIDLETKTDPENPNSEPQYLVCYSYSSSK